MAEPEYYWNNRKDILRRQREMYERDKVMIAARRKAKRYADHETRIEIERARDARSHEERKRLRLMRETDSATKASYWAIDGYVNPGPYRVGRPGVRQGEAPGAGPSKSKKRAYLAAYKATHVCETCAESDPRCLQFHHRDPSLKLFDIGLFHRGRFTMEMLVTEVAKCAILCANCHAALHDEERQQGKMRLLQTTIFLRAHKASHPCACGECRVGSLQFHHRDPSEKLFTIGNTGNRHSLAALVAEVAKCDVLCGNCHYKLHWSKPFT